VPGTVLGHLNSLKGPNQNSEMSTLGHTRSSERWSNLPKIAEKDLGNANSREAGFRARKETRLRKWKWGTGQGGVVW
jgi:hypothetical protein